MRFSPRLIISRMISEGQSTNTHTHASLLTRCWYSLSSWEACGCRQIRGLECHPPTGRTCRPVRASCCQRTRGWRRSETSVGSLQLTSIITSTGFTYIVHRNTWMVRARNTLTYPCSGLLESSRRCLSRHLRLETVTQWYTCYTLTRSRSI